MAAPHTGTGLSLFVLPIAGACVSWSGPVPGATPRFAPLPLLPGQMPLVRTAWTRLALLARVSGAVLAAWTIFHVVLGIVFLDMYGVDFAPELRSQAREFFVHAAVLLTLLLAVEVHLWWIARHLRRASGRPTRTSAGFLVAYAVIGAVAVLFFVAPWFLGGSVSL